MRLLRALFTVLAILAVSSSSLRAQQGKKEKRDPVGTISGSAFEMKWHASVDHERLVLSVIAPDGSSFQKEFKKGRDPVFQISDIPGGAIDGIYTYELRVVPFVPPGILKQMTDARDQGKDNEVLRLRFLSGLNETLVQSGGFTVLNGSFVSPDLEESTAGDASLPGVSASGEAGGRGRTAGRSGSMLEGPIETLDQVIPDDLIVQGSICAGLDCVNNESFGFDTIRMKENNTRIHFEDTSVGTFPSNDWEVTANDSASGGQNRFSIFDRTGSRTPFTLEAGASTNSIYVDSTGRVGFRTSTPVLDLHVSTSNTPAHRLEQTNAGGFTAQTWDIAGNEANFFIRDVTGGSRLPFRIRPGAPTSSIDIAATGFVGVNNAAPTARLHVKSTAGDARVFIEEASTTSDTRDLLQLINNGNARIRMTSTQNGVTIAMRCCGGGFKFTQSGGAGLQGDLMSLDVTGDMTIAGVLNQGSSRLIKTGFQDLNRSEILEKIAKLPLSSWSYLADRDSTHVGPMAEDFHASFGLGQDEKHISPSDLSGVALAGVQELHQRVEDKDARIRVLENENAEMARRLEALERRLDQILESPDAAPEPEMQ